MQAKLRVVDGKASRSEVPLKLPVVIGRSSDATLKIKHKLISRAHCELYEQDGYLYLRDNGSLNGTYVAGQRITEVLLNPGDQFTVGPLTFEAVYDPPEAPPAEQTATIDMQTTMYSAAPGAIDFSALEQAEAPAAEDDAPLAFPQFEESVSAAADATIDFNPDNAAAENAVTLQEQPEQIAWPTDEVAEAAPAAPAADDGVDMSWLTGAAATDTPADAPSLEEEPAAEAEAELPAVAEEEPAWGPLETTPEPEMAEELFTAEPVAEEPVAEEPVAEEQVAEAAPEPAAESGINFAGLEAPPEPLAAEEVDFSWLSPSAPANDAPPTSGESASSAGTPSDTPAESWSLNLGEAGQESAAEAVSDFPGIREEQNVLEEFASVARESEPAEAAPREDESWQEQLAELVDEPAASPAPEADAEYDSDTSIPTAVADEPLMSPEEFAAEPMAESAVEADEAMPVADAADEEEWGLSLEEVTPAEPPAPESSAVLSLDDEPVVAAEVFSVEIAEVRPVEEELSPLAELSVPSEQAAPVEFVAEVHEVVEAAPAEASHLVDEMFDVADSEAIAELPLEKPVLDFAQGAADDVVAWAEPVQPAAADWVSAVEPTSSAEPAEIEAVFMAADAPADVLPDEVVASDADQPLSLMDAAAEDFSEAPLAVVEFAEVEMRLEEPVAEVPPVAEETSIAPESVGELVDEAPHTAAEPPAAPASDWLAPAAWQPVDVSPDQIIDLGPPPSLLEPAAVAPLDDSPAPLEGADFASPVAEPLSMDDEFGIALDSPTQPESQAADADVVAAWDAPSLVEPAAIDPIPSEPVAAWEEPSEAAALAPDEPVWSEAPAADVAAQTEDVLTDIAPPLEYGLESSDETFSESVPPSAAWSPVPEPAAGISAELPAETTWATPAAAAAVTAAAGAADYLVFGGRTAVSAPVAPRAFQWTPLPSPEAAPEPATTWGVSAERMAFESATAAEEWVATPAAETTSAETILAEPPHSEATNGVAMPLDAAEPDVDAWLQEPEAAPEPWSQPAFAPAADEATLMWSAPPATDAAEPTPEAVDELLDDGELLDLSEPEPITAEALAEAPPAEIAWDAPPEANPTAEAEAWGESAEAASPEAASEAAWPAEEIAEQPAEISATDALGELDELAEAESWENADAGAIEPQELIEPVAEAAWEEAEAIPADDATMAWSEPATEAPPPAPPASQPVPPAAPPTKSKSRWWWPFGKKSAASPKPAGKKSSPPLAAAAPPPLPPAAAADDEAAIDMPPAVPLAMDDDEDGELLPLEGMLEEPELAEAELTFESPAAEPEAEPLNFSAVEEEFAAVETFQSPDQPAVESEAEPMAIDPDMLADAAEPEAEAIEFPTPPVESNGAVQAEFAEELVDDWLVAEPETAAKPPKKLEDDELDDFLNKLS